jgi:predicted Zn-dependent protease
MAMEQEVLAGLEQRWKFVTSSSLTMYLDSLTRQVAGRMEEVTATIRVVLVDDWSVRTLALPSGLLLISLGTLSFLEDEAELVFVLAHELAHAASGEAALRLVRLGYKAATEEVEDPLKNAWVESVLDLVRLGYGRQRERDADRRAMEAVLSLGYDSDSVFRYLKRIQGHIDQGDPKAAEIALAHPTPADRTLNLRKTMYGRLEGGRGRRVNREVFRRAAGPQVLSGPLTRTFLRRQRSAARILPEVVGSSLSKVAWIGLNIAVVAALILTLGLILSG